MENLPHIIALQEVKPKNVRYERSVEEHTIEGYEIITHNLDVREGRGLLLYVKKDLKCNTVELNSKFSEHASVEVKCENDSLLVTSVYRSPDSSEENSNELLQLFAGNT